ncbi:MAG: serine protease, partial [Aquificaceae bacterium]
MLSILGLFLLLTSFFGCKAQQVQSATPSEKEERPPIVSNVLSQFERELTSIVEAVSPSVVTIFATQERREIEIPFPFPFPMPPQERRSLGSGVIIYHRGNKL